MEGSTIERGIVVDTNVFVAAGFQQKSHSAEIVRMIREGVWRLVWNEETRGEIEHIVDRIPPLSSAVLHGVFRDEGRHEGKLDENPFDYISDPADRKFAALAVAAKVALISSDDHLLGCRDRIPISVLTPGEFLRLHPRRSE